MQVLTTAPSPPHRYGGSIAMEPEGSITVGNLITYQLYWNMLNNSLQALNNVLNEFTRAAGAAERVLSLVDLTPDIDPTAGLPVEQAVHAWSIEFRQVHFRDATVADDLAD